MNFVSPSKIFTLSGKKIQCNSNLSIHLRRSIAAEAQLYIDLFTGGDKDIEGRLEKYNRDNLESATKAWGISKEVFEYLERVRKSLKPLK